MAIKVCPGCNGKKIKYVLIKVRDPKSGKEAYVTATKTCPTCNGKGEITVEE
jgi:DnaJ-class molecular chaperone